MGSGHTQMNYANFKVMCVAIWHGLTKAPGKAFGLYSRAFRYNPYREDIARAMMIFYLDNALPCDALQVYTMSSPTI